MSMKSVFKNWKVIMLLIFLVLSYFSINGGLTPNFWNEGVTIRSVAPNSSAFLAGI